MFTVKNPGTWQQYLRANPTLPIMEAKRRFLIEQQNYNKVTGKGRPKSGGDPVPTTSTLPSGCIEFVNNTSDGTECLFWIETSAPTNYTITWGDGETTTGETTVGTGGGVGIGDGEDKLSISHGYADFNTEYTVRLCFDNISLVTYLEFNGDD
jgi:hypothetical protein